MNGFAARIPKQEGVPAIMNLYRGWGRSGEHPDRFPISIVIFISLCVPADRVIFWIQSGITILLTPVR